MERPSLERDTAAVRSHPDTRTPVILVRLYAALQRKSQVASNCTSA